ncbi:MAG TPA: cysteine desulfurase family protein, partial [Acidimicrobiales bacterium]
TGRFANPSGSHAASRDARRGLDEARDVAAAALGCAPGEVVFTGCGTEADNLAVLGTIRRHGGAAVCPATEHHAVLHAVEHLGGRVVAVDAAGAVDLDRLADALDPSVRLVSVMAVNNEVGTISPLEQVVALVRERAPDALLHTDAVQGFQWLDLPEAVRGCDLVAVSAHKFGGPKGVGALVVRGKASVEPLLMGGGQERDRRSGTHNVAGIVAMSEAMRVTAATRTETVERVRGMRDRLLDGLLAEVPGLSETVPRDRKSAGSAHVCVEGVESEALLFLLDREGVCASAASACSSGAMDPSHVLAAMGLPRAVAGGSLRLSLGWASEDAEIDRVLEVLPPAVRRLRREVPVA